MKLHIIAFPLGQMQANCYFLVKGSRCIIIDPADDASFILEELQRRNLSLSALIATHGHFDHVMAAAEIQLSFPHVPFYLHPEDIFLMKRLGETAKYFLGYEPHVFPPQKITPLKKGNLSVDGFLFEVIETPGHTPGSCSLYSMKEQIVFTGDTLFKQNIGRYDFSYSSRKDLKKSLQSLLELPKATVIYPGHGGATSVGNEHDIPLAFFS